jgi:hypothetical protein
VVKCATYQQLIESQARKNHAVSNGSFYKNALKQVLIVIDK